MVPNYIIHKADELPNIDADFDPISAPKLNAEKTIIFDSQSPKIVRNMGVIDASLLSRKLTNSKISNARVYGDLPTFITYSKNELPIIDTTIDPKLNAEKTIIFDSQKPKLDRCMEMIDMNSPSCELTKLTISNAHVYGNLPNVTKLILNRPGYFQSKIPASVIHPICI